MKYPIVLRPDAFDSAVPVSEVFASIGYADNSDPFLRDGVIYTTREVSFRVLPNRCGGLPFVELELETSAEDAPLYIFLESGANFDRINKRGLFIVFDVTLHTVSNGSAGTEQVIYLDELVEAYGPGGTGGGNSYGANAGLNNILPTSIPVTFSSTKNFTVVYDTSSGNIVQTFPAATGRHGQRLYFYKGTSDAHTASVNGIVLAKQGDFCAWQAIETNTFVGWMKMGAGSISSISNGPGEVSVNETLGTIAALVQGDNFNHSALFTTGVKTSNGNDFGFDIAAYRGGANDGNRIIEIRQRNCTQVIIYDLDSYILLGTPTLGGGYVGSYHTDTYAYINYASNGPTGFRVIDRNTGKTRAYFSGGVQVGADDAFSAAITLTLSHYACYFDTSAGAITQPLPSATGMDGREFVFFKGSNDANMLTIGPLSGQGVSTTLATQDSSVTYRAFNGKWRRVALIN